MINSKGFNFRDTVYYLSFSSILFPDVLSPPTNFLINTEINQRMWPNSTDDDLRLLDGFLSPTINGLSTLPNLPDHSQSLNNNSSQLINTTDEKQLIGPLDSNL